MDQNTTGYANTATGMWALRNNSSGYANGSDGYYALYNNTSGYQNTGVGLYSLYLQSTEYNSAALGAWSGYYATTQGTYVGAYAYANASGYTNTGAFGYNARPTASNMIRIGNTAVTSINGAVAFTVVSDGRFKTHVNEDVHGLDFIMKLRPVTYNYDVKAMDTFIEGGERKGPDGNPRPYSAEELASIKQKEQVRYSGFIAQEVEKAADSTGYDFSGVDKPDNEKDPYGLRYSDFVVPMVKAMQEQQKMIEDLKKMVQQQQKEIEDLKKR